MTCPHPERWIDGVYYFNNVPYAVAFTCLSCRTSGGKLYYDTTEAERAEANLVEASRDKESEAMVR